MAVLGSMATMGVVSYKTNKLLGYENAVNVGSSSKSNLFVLKRLELSTTYVHPKLFNDPYAI